MDFGVILFFFGYVLSLHSSATPIQPDEQWMERFGKGVHVPSNHALNNLVPALPLPRSPKTQLFSFSEVIDSLQQALPVSLYLNLPMCWQSEARRNISAKDSWSDFPQESYSVDVEYFEYVNDQKFSPYPSLFFADTPIVRTSGGVDYYMREAAMGPPDGVSLLATWLSANYTPVHQTIFGCQLQNSSKGSGGNVRAMVSKVGLQRVQTFDQLKTAIEGGYNFRFYVRYKNCIWVPQQPTMNSFSGGIIKGMRLAANGSYATFSRAEMGTDLLPPHTYVTNIFTATIYKSGYYAKIVTSENRDATFQPMINTTVTYFCPINSSVNAMDLYVY